MPAHYVSYDSTLNTAQAMTYINHSALSEVCAGGMAAGQSHCILGIKFNVSVILTKLTHMVFWLLSHCYEHMGRKLINPAFQKLRQYEG